MERRKFIKSIAAVASAPLVPFGFLKGEAFSSSVYENAVNFVSNGAHFSAKGLKSALGLDDAAGEILVSRLKADGLVGDMGRSGLMFSKSFYPKHIVLAAPAAQAVTTVQANGHAGDALKQVRRGLTQNEAFEPVDVRSATETPSDLDIEDKHQSINSTSPEAAIGDEASDQTS